MKILVIGGGGREHALVWRLLNSPTQPEVLACPGNPGVAQICRCIPMPSTLEHLADLARFEKVDYTIVGPEAPLVAGIVDLFRERQLPIVGPTKAAAQLEGSKFFAKELFLRAAIPTAATYSSLDQCRYPVVIKADGLASGKGVIIAHNREEADSALKTLGGTVLLEEFLEGEEISFICLTDGTKVLPFLPAQDHKRALDGDKGPNTGGMGAYCDARLLADSQRSEILSRVIYPTLEAMHLQGMPFTGFLYAGLMMTADGPKVLEFNARLGDPETQPLLLSLKTDLAQVLEEAARGKLTAPALDFGGPAVCVVAAAEGYPGAPTLGDRIGHLPADSPDLLTFHAGTKSEGDQLLTAGGRVLGITAKATTLPEAISRAYEGVRQVQFRGMQFRSDIGQRGLKRW